MFGARPALCPPLLLYAQMAAAHDGRQRWPRMMARGKQRATTGPQMAAHIARKGKPTARALIHII